MRLWRVGAVYQGRTVHSAAVNNALWGLHERLLRQDLADKLDYKRASGDRPCRLRSRLVTRRRRAEVAAAAARPSHPHTPAGLDRHEALERAAQPALYAAHARPWRVKHPFRRTALSAAHRWFPQYGPQTSGRHSRLLRRLVHVIELHLRASVPSATSYTAGRPPQGRFGRRVCVASTLHWQTVTSRSLTRRGPRVMYASAARRHVATLTLRTPRATHWRCTAGSRRASSWRRRSSTTTVDGLGGLAL
jgi:hypothetical protein